MRISIFFNCISGFFDGIDNYNDNITPIKLISSEINTNIHTLHNYSQTDDACVNDVTYDDKFKLELSEYDDENKNDIYSSPSSSATSSYSYDPHILEKSDSSSQDIEIIIKK